jgi:16S rRNA (guanine527-N7)-methyltransferase
LSGKQDDIILTTAILDSEDAARAWVGDAFAPSAEQWARLDRFVDLLVSESTQQNLIASSTVPTMWVRHIADSAQLLALDQRDGDGLWIDLGSGAGLPGLVVAILSPRPMLLVESRKRRCDFLRSVAADIGLAHVEIVEAPLERIETRSAATISARAFAPLDKLLDLSARFSTESTRWLLPKGRNAVKELALLPEPWQRMFHVEQSRTDAESQILVGNGKIAVKQQRGKR